MRDGMAAGRAGGNSLRGPCLPEPPPSARLLPLRVAQATRGYHPMSLTHHRADWGTRQGTFRLDLANDAAPASWSASSEPITSLPTRSFSPGLVTAGRTGKRRAGDGRCGTSGRTSACWIPTGPLWPMSPGRATSSTARCWSCFSGSGPGRGARGPARGTYLLLAALCFFIFSWI